MTVEWVYQGYGYYSTDAKKAGSLSPASFKVDGTTYTVKMVETQGWWMYIGVDRELPFGFVLELDGAGFASNDASFRSYSYGNIYRWEGTGLSWRDGDIVEVRLLRAFEDETAVNSTATGAPIISGTAQVGEPLTADTSGISPTTDGLEKRRLTPTSGSPAARTLRGRRVPHISLSTPTRVRASKLGSASPTMAATKSH